MFLSCFRCLNRLGRLSGLCSLPGTESPAQGDLETALGRCLDTAAAVRDAGVVAAVQADGREKGAAAAIMMGL